MTNKKSFNFKSSPPPNLLFPSVLPSLSSPPPSPVPRFLQVLLENGCRLNVEGPAICSSVLITPCFFHTQRQQPVGSDRRRQKRDPCQCFDCLHGSRLAVRITSSAAMTMAKQTPKKSNVSYGWNLRWGTQRASNWWMSRNSRHTAVAEWFIDSHEAILQPEFLLMYWILAYAGQKLLKVVVHHLCFSVWSVIFYHPYFSVWSQSCIDLRTIVSLFAAQSGAVEAESKVPSVENPGLKVLRLKLEKVGAKPCMLRLLPGISSLLISTFLVGPFTFIFFQNLFRVFPVLTVANAGSCDGPQNKIGLCKCPVTIFSLPLLSVHNWIRPLVRWTPCSKMSFCKRMLNLTGGGCFPHRLQSGCIKIKTKKHNYVMLT